jgi:hypothetical protein
LIFRYHQWCLGIVDYHQYAQVKNNWNLKHQKIRKKNLKEVPSKEICPSQVNKPLYLFIYFGILTWIRSYKVPTNRQFTLISCSVVLYETECTCYSDRTLIMIVCIVIYKHLTISNYKYSTCCTLIYSHVWHKGLRYFFS